MQPSFESAPDAHWLLVKEKWIPIERLIDALVPGEGDVIDKINALNPKLTPDVLSTLHKLRKSRNDLLHNNKPLPDVGLWERTSGLVLRELQEASEGRFGGIDTLSGRQACFQAFAERVYKVRSVVAWGGVIGYVAVFGSILANLAFPVFELYGKVFGGSEKDWYAFSFFALVGLFVSTLLTKKVSDFIIARKAHELELI